MTSGRRAITGALGVDARQAFELVAQAVGAPGITKGQASHLIAMLAKGR